MTIQRARFAVPGSGTACAGLPALVRNLLLDDRMRTVLLDVDGTLVDSNDAHAQAWVEALGASGYTVPFERARALIGKGGDKLLWETVGVESDSDLGKSIDEKRASLFEQCLPSLRPFPGARELLQRMHEDGHRLVVATSAKEEEMRALLDIVGARPFLFAQTSSDAASNSKPDPDIIQAALRRAQARPSQAYMLGDTPYDIEAATRAGVSTVGLRSGGWKDADLKGAIAIFDDTFDLLAHYAESPFGGSVESQKPTPRSVRVP